MKGLLIIYYHMLKAIPWQLKYLADLCLIEMSHNEEVHWLG